MSDDIDEPDEIEEDLDGEDLDAEDLDAEDLDEADLELGDDLEIEGGDTEDIQAILDLFRADLDTILRERLASDDEDEDEEDEDGEPKPAKGSSEGDRREDEILCEGCFLLVAESQFDTRGPEPLCPHCGTPLPI